MLAVLCSGRTVSSDGRKPRIAVEHYPPLNREFTVNYLAIDASTEACSVAVKFEGKIYSSFEVCPQSHSLRLLPMIDEILKEAACTLKDLDGLIFGRGPGSFTGVRIGIGVAQGLAFSADLPVVGVSTLQTLAQWAHIEGKIPVDKNQVIAAIDARMGEVYTGVFTLENNKESPYFGLMQPQSAEAVLAPELLAEHYIKFTVAQTYAVGTGWEAYDKSLSALKSDKNHPELLFPHAEAMLSIGEAAFANDEGVTAEHAQPVYVRDTVSWKKLPGK
jgi:tRNA threonylcarbamoyladenosine biosynthesis protein TsaB